MDGVAFLSLFGSLAAKGQNQCHYKPFKDSYFAWEIMKGFLYIPSGSIESE